MTSRVSKLALVAVLAGSIPALAFAHDGDRDCDHRPGARPAFVTTPVVMPPPPAGYPAPPAPPAWRDGWRDGPRDGWRDRRGPELSWRERELASIHGELARLDAERAEFHARFAYRPGQLRRYDRHYFERRAQLEHREHELMRFAWR